MVPMRPATISHTLAALYPNAERLSIGPPQGVAEEDCGTIEALISKVEGGAFDGARNFRVFWKPSADDIERMLAGHEVEVQFICPMLIPHTVGVV